MTAKHHYLFRFFTSTTWQQISPANRRLFAAILLLHFILSGWFISRTYFTNDEYAYYGWAVRWAQGHQERIEPTDDSKTPIVAPALLPIILKPWLQKADDAHGYALLQAGRWMMYVYQLFGAVIMLLCCYRLWGGRKWVFPLVLYLFDPEVFSFGMLVGSDVPSMVLLFATCFAAWRYWQSNELRHWLWVGIFLSMAVVAKASMLYAIPLCMLLFVIAPKQANHIRIAAWKRWLLLLFIVWLFVHVAYYFQHSFFPVAQLPQKSTAFQQLAAMLSSFSQWPVPLPYGFVSGFDLLKYNEQLGGGNGPIYSFLGVYFNETYFARGPVWYYYGFVFMYKWPLYAWAMLLLAVGLLFRNMGSWLYWRQRVFWWMPLLVYGLLLSFVNPFQIGMRHALLLFPFLYLLVGYAANWCWARYQKTTRLLLLLYTLSWVSYWPNMLSYTNELLWPKHLAYRKLFDSSISYGHAKPYLDRFLQLNPEYKRPTSTPAAGKFAIDLETVAAPLNAHGLQWLHTLKPPHAHYMHVVLLYEVTEADLQKTHSNVLGK